MLENECSAILETNYFALQDIVSVEEPRDEASKFEKGLLRTFKAIEEELLRRGYKLPLDPEDE